MIIIILLYVLQQKLKIYLVRQPNYIEYIQDFSKLFKLKDDRDKIYYNDTSYTVSYESEFNKIVNKPTLNPGDTATVVMVFKLEKFVYQQYGVYLNILDNKSLIKIN